MSCDAFANDEGVFEIEVRDYQNIGGVKFQPKVIRIEDLEPCHKISIEILEGESR